MLPWGPSEPRAPRRGFSEEGVCGWLLFRGRGDKRGCRATCTSSSLCGWAVARPSHGRSGGPEPSGTCLGNEGLGQGSPRGPPGGNLRRGVKMRAAGWGPNPALTRGVSALSRSCRPRPASTATGAPLKVTGHQASQGPQGPCSFLIQTRPPRVSEFSHLHTGLTVILPVQAFSRI